MGAVQYEHYEGHKLTQAQLDNRAAQGWVVQSHICSSEHVHKYVFKKTKA